MIEHVSRETTTRQRAQRIAIRGGQRRCRRREQAAARKPAISVSTATTATAAATTAVAAATATDDFVNEHARSEDGSDATASERMEIAGRR